MKLVQLLEEVTIVEGAVRYPIEPPFKVNDETAAELKAAGKLCGEPQDVPAERASRKLTREAKRG